MLNVVIFGPPGSGKGTQGQKIAEKYGLEHVSTGELCRRAIHTNTHEGVIAKSFIDRGELVPDETIIDMLDSFLEHLPVGKGIIFDGYPRTVAQAEALTDIMTAHGTKVSVMLNLEVDNEELKNRLSLRGETSGRSDDNTSTIERRLEVYDERTLPVIDFYKKKRLYKAVDGIGDIDQVFDRACTILDSIKK